MIILIIIILLIIIITIIIIIIITIIIKTIIIITIIRIILNAEICYSVFLPTAIADTQRCSASYFFIVIPLNN